MSGKVFEAPTVEDALKEAATALDVSIEELEHEVVEEKSDDFWGMGETVLAVRVWVAGAETETPEATAAGEDEEVAAPAAVTPAVPDSAAAADDVGSSTPAAAKPEAAEGGDEDFFTAPEPTPEQAEEPQAPAPPAVEAPAPSAAAAAAPVPPDAPAAADDSGAEPAPARGAGADLGEEAVELLHRVFAAMGFDSRATARLDGDTLHVAITGDDNAYLLEGRGRGLSALELVLNHAFRHRDDRAHRRVRVDAGDFRNQREEEIRDLAFQVAHQAKETGSPQQTGSLNPYERRIVHLTLADDANVTTRSLGNGFMKAVSVIPKAGGGHRRR